MHINEQKFQEHLGHKNWQMCECHPTSKFKKEQNYTAVREITNYIDCKSHLQPIHSKMLIIYKSQ